MIKIRVGLIDDLHQAFELIRELADYENGLSEVTNTVEKMREDGFGNSPVFNFFVAENENHVVGIAVYYYRYSTWKGKRLYLEDIIVTKDERGNGIGKLLFDEVMRKTLMEGCTGMMWQVLDWNEPALKFYRRYDAKVDTKWINCSLEAPHIESLLTK